MAALPAHFQNGALENKVSLTTLYYRTFHKFYTFFPFVSIKKVMLKSFREETGTVALVTVRCADPCVSVRDLMEEVSKDSFRATGKGLEMTGCFLAASCKDGKWFWSLKWWIAVPVTTLVCNPVICLNRPTETPVTMATCTF